MASLREGLMLQGGGVVSLVGAGGKTTLMYRVAREISESGETVLTTTTTKMFPPVTGQCPFPLISPLPQEILSRARGILKGGAHIFAAYGRIDDGKKLKGFAPEIVELFWRSGLFQWILVEADGAAQRSLKAPAPHEPVIPAVSRWVVGVAGLDVVGKPLQESSVFRSERYAELSGLPLGAPVTEASVARLFVHERGIMRGCPSHALRLAFLNKVECEGGLAAGRRVVRHLSGTEARTLERVVLGSAALDPPVAEWYDKTGERFPVSGRRA